MVPYDDARQAQKRLEAARQAGAIPDVLLLLLEHPPVYTKGRRTGARDELPMGEDWYRMQGIEVGDTDRGGRVTYHGPGQLVGYPIVDLRALRRRRPRVRPPDGAGDDRLAGRPRSRGRADRGADRGLDDRRPCGRRSRHAERVAEHVAGGEGRKIGSIGVHVNRGITTHGLAINVNNDLQPFEWIVPCGIEGCRMTSLCREARRRAGHGRLHRHRARDVRPRSTSDPLPGASELAATVDGLDALAANAGGGSHDHGYGRRGTVGAMAERLHVTRSRARPGGAKDGGR